jgi:hypothetical protein
MDITLRGLARCTTSPTGCRARQDRLIYGRAAWALNTSTVSSAVTATNGNLPYTKIPSRFNRILGLCLCEFCPRKVCPFPTQILDFFVHIPLTSDSGLGCVPVVPSEASLDIHWLAFLIPTCPSRPWWIALRSDSRIPSLARNSEAQIDLVSRLCGQTWWVSYPAQQVPCAQGS